MSNFKTEVAALEMYEGIDNGFFDLAREILEKKGFKVNPILITKEFKNDKLENIIVEDYKLKRFNQLKGGKTNGKD